MKTLNPALPVATIILASCNATMRFESSTTEDVPQQTSVTPEEDSAEVEERRTLERELRLAHARLEIQRLEAESAAMQEELRLHHAELSLEEARQTLSVFEESVAPERLARERLSLESAKDRAREAADELAQIEIMYKDQDLDDLTAEFVVSRGRRNAERAAKRIELEELAFARLEAHEIPQEARSLTLAVQKAEAELEGLRREREIANRRRDLDLWEARHKLDEKRKELEEMGPGAPDAESAPRHPHEGEEDHHQAEEGEHRHEEQGHQRWRGSHEHSRSGAPK